MAETTTPDAEQLMNDYFALRRGDESKLDVLSESFRFHGGLGEIRGREGLLAMQEDMQRAFPDADLEVHDMLVGDTVAFWDWTISGTHEGEYDGIAPSGRTISVSGISKTTIVDGTIQENWASFDSQEFLSQLRGEE